MFQFIIGLVLCLLTMSIFLYIRTNKGGIAGLNSKIIASFAFIIFGIFLMSAKSGISTFSRLGCACVVAGLVCGLIGDIFLDLKVIYPFQEDKFLAGGMTWFSVGHLFYIASLLLFATNYLDLFTNHYIALVIVFSSCLLLTLVIWLISTKVLEFNYGKFTHFVNFYTFLLLLTTEISGFLCFILVNKPMYVLLVGFVLFFLSDGILSFQYFNGKPNDKNLIFVNHLFYYLAQITIASFLFFV